MLEKKGMLKSTDDLEVKVQLLARKGKNTIM